MPLTPAFTASAGAAPFAPNLRTSAFSSRICASPTSLPRSYRAPPRPSRTAFATASTPPPAAAASAEPGSSASSAPSIPPPTPLILPDGSVGGENRVGAFAVYDDAEALQYVGISRDVATSLRRVLFRRPQLAHYFSAVYLESSRPSRAALDELRERVIAGRDVPGLDGGGEQARWEEAVDVRTCGVATEEEIEALERAEPGELGPILKKVVKRVQGPLVAPLKERGLKEALKFEGKLKAKGLLDVGSVKIKVPDSIGASTARVEDDDGK